MKTLFFLFFLFALIFIQSCADQITEYTQSIDQIDNTGEIGARFSDINEKVFSKSCAIAGCHVTGVQPPDLSVNAYENIYRKPSSKGLNYIEPGNPEASYLFLKITGSPLISGGRMPAGASPLSGEIIDSIRAWILDGAKNN